MTNQTAKERYIAMNRRNFLRGLGVCLALPTFESLGGFGATASEAATAGLATTASGAPLRMAFLYVPNGVLQDSWWPKTEGKNFELTTTIAPLEKVRNQLQ